MWNHEALTPRLGSEITGLDLARLSESDFQSIHELFSLTTVLQRILS